MLHIWPRTAGCDDICLLPPKLVELVSRRLGWPFKNDRVIVESNGYAHRPCRFKKVDGAQSVPRQADVFSLSAPCGGESASAPSVGLTSEGLTSGGLTSSGVTGLGLGTSSGPLFGSSHSIFGTWVSNLPRQSASGANLNTRTRSPASFCLAPWTPGPSRSRIFFDHTDLTSGRQSRCCLLKST